MMSESRQKVRIEEMRRHLTSMNYPVSFGFDSLDLIEHLVKDLVATTKSYEHLQEKEARLASDLGLAQAQLFPLRKENARLAREAHQLHIDNVQIGDDHSNFVAQQVLLKKRLEDELDELKMVSKMKDEIIIRKDREIERYREAYNGVVDPSLKQNSGAGLKRVITITSPVPRDRPTLSPSHIGSTSGKFLHGPNNGDGHNMTQMSAEELEDGDECANLCRDEVVATLRQQLAAAQLAVKASREESQRLKSSLVAREAELVRISKTSGAAETYLTSSLSVAPSAQSRAEQLMAADEANKRVIDQLNGQIDFLNEQLAQREAELGQAVGSCASAEELRLDYEHMIVKCRRVTEENLKLTQQTHALEKRVLEYEDMAAESEQEDEMSDHDNDDDFGGDTQHINNSTATAARNKPALSVNTRLGSAGTRPAAAAHASRQGRKEGTTAAINKQNTSQGASSTRQQHKIDSLPLSRATAAKDSLLTKLSAQNDALWSEQQQGRGGAAGAGGDREDDSVRVVKLKRRLQQAEEQLATCRLELEAAGQQAASLARAVSSKNSEASRQEQSKRDMESAVQSLEHKLAEQSQQLVAATSDASAARHELQVCMHEKEVSAALVAELQGEVVQRVSQRGALASERETLAQQLSQAQEDLQRLLRAADKSSKEGGILRQELNKLTIKCAQLESDVESVTWQRDSSDKRAEQLQEQLTLQTTECEDVSQALALLQASRAPSDVSSQLKTDLRAARDKLTVLSQERAQWQVEKDQLLKQVHLFSGGAAKAGGSYSAMATAALEERQQHTQLIAEKDDNIASLEQAVYSLQTETDRLKTQLSSRDSMCHTAAATAQDRNAQLQAKDGAAAQLSSELRLLQRRLADAEMAYKQSREACEDGNAALTRATDRLSTSDREVVKLREEVMVLRSQVELREGSVDSAQRHLELQTRRAQAGHQELQQAQLEQAQLHDQVEELKGLVVTMEASVKSHLNKNTRLSVALGDEAEASKALQLEVQHLQSLLAQAQTTHNSLQEALDKLNAENEELKLTVDNDYQKAIQQDRVHGQLENHSQQLQQMIARLEQKLTTSNKDLTESQRQCQKFEARINSISEENLELRREVHNQGAQVTGASKDLMLMTRENQAVTSELARATADREKLRCRLSEVVQMVAASEQAKRSVEIERDDLLVTYKQVLKAKRQLEVDYDAVGSAKQRASHSVQQLHTQVAELRGVVTGQQSQEKQWLTERTSLCKQLDNVNDELVAGQRRLEAVEADNKRLMQDTHGLRQTNMMLNERMQLVMKRVASTADTNKILSSRLASVERERDVVNRLAGVERQRSSDLGHVVEVTRAQAAAKEMELQRLRSQTAAVAGAPARSQPQTRDTGRDSDRDSRAESPFELMQALSSSDQEHNYDNYERRDDGDRDSLSDGIPE